MTVIMLHEASNVGSDRDYRYCDISSIQHCYSLEHTHDFFEILLVVSGCSRHVINQHERICRQGSLILFRPDDRHSIGPEGQHECHLVNITYRKRVFEALRSYMDCDAAIQAYLTADMPRIVELDSASLDLLLSRLQDLNNLSPGQEAAGQAAWKLLLHELIYQYVCKQENLDDRSGPDWFVQLCQDMQQREFFIGGVTAMTALSGKSHGYLCRSFKKHLQTTPVAYINQLRLNYACNLLVNTDRSILDICLDIGFSSLGHFYRLFSRQYGISPQRYRQINWPGHHLLRPGLVNA